MNKTRLFSPFCITLVVLFVMRAVYTVAKGFLVSLIDRLAPGHSSAFIVGSANVEFVIFTVLVLVCFIALGAISTGRQRAALWVIAAPHAVTVLSRLVLSYLFTRSLLLSAATLAVCAVISFIGYAMLANTARDLRAIGWLCAVFTALSFGCSAFSSLSAQLMDGSAATLWFVFFTRSAQISSALGILANVMQALCMLLMLFTAQKDARDAVAENTDAQK